MAVFDDALFLWNPGDAETNPYDMVTEAEGTAFTSYGTLVDQLGQDGRTYDGVEGEYWDLAEEIGGHNSDWSAFCVVSWPTDAGNTSGSFGVANPGDSDRWIRIHVEEANDRINGELRCNGSNSFGDNDRPGVRAESLSENTLYTAILTFDYTGSNQGTLTLYVNSGTAIGTDTLNTASPANVDRVYVARLADSSPTNPANDVAYYAAGVWDRLLSGAEISEILSDPYAYMDPVVATQKDVSVYYHH